MDGLSRYEIWYGRDCPPPEIRPLRAGPLRVEFEAGDLRYIRLGHQELVRRIYVAIRDPNWNTIPGRLSDLHVNAQDDRFTIAFRSAHVAGPLEFDWQATVEGTSEGVITYAMEGTARSAFRYCRIGFCVLHPLRECVGRPYRAQTPEGPISGQLPLLIGPQPIVNGFEAPLFPSFSSLAITLENGVEVSFDFEGDLFEMEDQRNWTDGSFKTYCTPLALGYPHEARAGQRFYQKVTVHVAPLPTDAVKGPPAASEQPARLILGEALGRKLPQLGFGLPRDGEHWSERQTRLLSRLRPAHLKTELHTGTAEWPTALERASEAARRLGTRLEVAVFLDDRYEEALQALHVRLPGVPVARLIVFHASEANVAATSPRWVELVRQRLGAALPGVPIGGGTNANFAELNRAWPDVRPMDFICFPINPQVHATDERSLVEALEAQESTIFTARAHCGPLPVCVSSVTLKPPFNAVAREEETPPAPDELPPSVDPRQMSLFAAVWTVGSLSALAKGGAASITYYETTGWRGLMETEQGNPLPAKFRSQPGMVFPLYHLFADIAEGTDGEIVEMSPSDPLRVQGLAVQGTNRMRVWVANMLPTPQEVSLERLPQGRSTTVHRLNEHTAPQAMFEPEDFRSTPGEEKPTSGDRLILELEPYELARVDIQV